MAQLTTIAPSNSTPYTEGVADAVMEYISKIRLADNSLKYIKDALARQTIANALEDLTELANNIAALSQRGYVEDDDGVPTAVYPDGTVPPLLGDALRYQVANAETIISGSTMTVNLADRAANSVSQGASTALNLVFPVIIADRVRDFVMVLTCGATPPTISYPSGVTILAESSASLTPQEGVNIYSFKEIQANQFVASRKLVIPVVSG